MFAGGTETSATAMEWMVTELIRNPTELQKVQNEVLMVAQSKEIVSVDDINKMSYMKATIKEAMRLHPPTPLLIPRRSMNHLRLDKYDIPPETSFIINAWAIGRDSKYWDVPIEFKPERFLKSNVDFKGQDFQFVPFGAGRRICPGITFAMSTIELTMANLLYHFDWKLPDGMNEEVLDVSETTGLVARKKSNLILVAVPRNPQHCS